MKQSKFAIVRWGLLLGSILFITLCRHFPEWAEGYARNVYPVISACLSAFSSLFPFSLEEPLVILLIGGMVLYPVVARRRGTAWKKVGLRWLEGIAWIYIWFYWGWGLNYFRTSIYTRAQVTPAAYDATLFSHFLATYAADLNQAYTPSQEADIQVMDRELRTFYIETATALGLTRPQSFQVPKYFTFTSLYSGVGVLGSMGPFWAEAQLNADLPPLQLPFTYAHEFSHLLGVSSEAEANYWAYHSCIRSSLPAVRYSGYFGILPYVLSNASALLPEDAFRAWVQTIRPEVLEDYEQKRLYWHERYHPLIGKIQRTLYDGFLKGNRISSGRKNYAEVVGLLLSVPLP